MYLAAISYLHHSNGFQSPIHHKAPEAEACSQRAPKGTGCLVRHCKIASKMLMELSQSLYARKMYSTHDCLLLQAALAVAIFGFLRVSEFTVNSSKRKAMRRGRFLAKQEVLLAPHKLQLTIKYSKTDQLGNGSIVTMGLTREACCPALAMTSYLRRCQAKPAAPLFHFKSCRPLSARRSTLHSLLRQNGYDPGNYNTHSFRIGAATAAARAGLPPATIKQLGRWRSDAYSTYDHHTPNHSTTAQIAISLFPYLCFVVSVTLICLFTIILHGHQHFGSNAFMGLT